jgi:hypothetical protein
MMIKGIETMKKEAVTTTNGTGTIKETETTTEKTKTTTSETGTTTKDIETMTKELTEMTIVAITIIIETTEEEDLGPDLHMIVVISSSIIFSIKIFI